MKKMNVKNLTWSIAIAVMLLSGCGAKKNVIYSGTVGDETVVQDNYALLRIYRTSAIHGAGSAIDVVLDSERVFRAKNNSKTTIKISDEGVKFVRTVLFNQVNDELPVDFQFGNEYYIRCSWKSESLLISKAILEFMDEGIGKFEFEQINSINKSK